MTRRKKQKRNYLAPALVLGVFLVGALAVSAVTPAKDASAQVGSGGVSVQIDASIEVLRELLGLARPQNTEPAVGGFAGPDVFQHVQFHSGVTKTLTHSTSTTATSYTLLVNDLVDRNSGAFYDTLFITPNVGTLTLTTFASSSARHVLRTPGEIAEQCIFNATSTAGVNIKLAAGTGFDLEHASSTGAAEASSALPSIPPQGMGCFKFMRQERDADSYDIGMYYTPYINSD